MQKILHGLQELLRFKKIDIDSFEKQDAERMFKHTNKKKIYSDQIDGINISMIKKAHHNIFKVEKDDSIEYYIVNTVESIGAGEYGQCYQGINVTTKKAIVGKYGEIYQNEIICLERTGLYIACIPGGRLSGIVLMYRAPGRDYIQILMDETITDHEKTKIHENIINKYIELNKIHHILHRDVKPEHIFVAEDGSITLIDFGLSYCFDSVNKINKHYQYQDILTLCEFAKNIPGNYCGNEFKIYNETQLSMYLSYRTMRRISDDVKGYMVSIFNDMNSFMNVNTILVIIIGLIAIILFYYLIKC